MTETPTPRDTEPTPGTPTPWMTRAEAAAYLRVSLRTFDRMRERGAIRGYPMFATQTSQRFHRRDLDAVLKSDGQGEGS